MTDLLRLFDYHHWHCYSCVEDEKEDPAPRMRRNLSKLLMNSAALEGNLSEEAVAAHPGSLLLYPLLGSFVKAVGAYFLFSLVVVQRSYFIT